MKTTLLAVLTVSACFAGPNLSGEWKINLAKSDYGPVPAPTSFVRKITHEDPKLLLKTTQVGQAGEITTEVTWTTDGKESVNTIKGAEVRGAAKWDADNLVLEYKRPIQGSPMNFKEVWALSDEGKTLTINMTAKGDLGEFQVKIVLEKQ